MRSWIRMISPANSSTRIENNPGVIGRYWTWACIIELGRRQIRLAASHEMATMTNLSAGPDQGGMKDVALRTGRDGVEWPAGRQHELVALRRGVDAGGIEADHGRSVRAIAKVSAVTARDLDLVTDHNVLQKAKVRVAVRGIDGDAAFAGLGSVFDMAGTEGERLAAGARQHDGAGADPLHLDPCHRPGIRPRPRLDLTSRRNARRERAFQQHLREPRLGVDVGAVAEQDRADERQNERRDEAGHCYHTRYCERSEAIQNLSAAAAWIA